MKLKKKIPTQMTIIKIKSVEHLMRYDFISNILKGNHESHPTYHFGDGMCHLQSTKKAQKTEKIGYNGKALSSGDGDNTVNICPIEITNLVKICKIHYTRWPTKI